MATRGSRSPADAGAAMPAAVRVRVRRDVNFIFSISFMFV